MTPLLYFLATGIGMAGGFWVARRRWSRKVAQAYKKGLEDGKKEALAAPYRDPAPLPPPRPRSPLEESLDRLAGIMAASGIYMADTMDRD